MRHTTPALNPVARLMATRPRPLSDAERVVSLAELTERRATQQRRLRADRALRPVVRAALLGDKPLPTRGWEQMSRGRTRPATQLFERALEARAVSKRAAADVRAGLHAVADTIADLIERELPRAA